MVDTFDPMLDKRLFNELHVTKITQIYNRSQITKHSANKDLLHFQISSIRLV